MFLSINFVSLLSIYFVSFGDSVGLLQQICSHILLMIHNVVGLVNLLRFNSTKMGEFRGLLSELIYLKGHAFVRFPTPRETTIAFTFFVLLQRRYSLNGFCWKFHIKLFIYVAFLNPATFFRMLQGIS